MAITGLLGILVAAKQENLIPQLRPVVDRLLHQAKFHVHPQLYQQVLRDVGEAD